MRIIDWLLNRKQSVKRHKGSQNNYTIDDTQVYGDVIDELNDEGTEVDLRETPMPVCNLYESGNTIYDSGDDMQSALHCDNTDNYNPFDMKNTPMESDFEREFLDYMLLSDTSRIVWRNYDLDKEPPELCMLTYKRKGNQTMRQLRDNFRVICKRHNKVIDRFCLSDSYTFEDQRCILASWRDKK